ncbi:hypothetical protein BO70DRAFT_362474 [Aspergillus heteromorphus CBS 117.55]|uniref:Uncharacterized protein n=1 Tax=Aspergillus heteromorphus CBS 117.55 TaxID=1448321 RepID=A0A317W8R1_9EURO|nr:uncharacterized protein BO70DRAFT_362474 [Aspergillus heteromorphus CBS 117.55]PWY80520.1 hypothetical protein BO70DRAFT_362474 [Aspergillus heteromorphus CBS 117.55]
MFARSFAPRACLQQCPRSLRSYVFESSSPAWRYFSSSASRTKAAGKVKQASPPRQPEDTLKFAGRRPEGFGRLERKVAQEGELVLFAAPSHRSYVIGAYGIAAFCFAYSVFNSNAVFRDPVIEIPMWQKSLFGGVCVAMSAMGTVMLVKTARLVRTVKAVSTKGQASIRFTVRSIVPFRKPFEFDALPHQIAFSRRLVISPDAISPMQQQAQVASKVSLFKTPAKALNMALWAVFQSIRQIFTQEGFILLEVEGQNGVFRMDSAGFISEDFFVIGNPTNMRR